jgi:hypothetical protein
MSHHILQQFDEQVLAEIASGKALQNRELLCSSTAHHSSEQPSRQWFALSAPRQWLVLAVALVIATLALLIANDAQRRADDLQRRLAAYERAIDKIR